MIQTNLNSKKDIQKIFLKSKKSKVLKPFDERIINFLNLFRENLIKLNKTNNIIDIYALIFYLRKTNILKIKSEYNYLDYAVGIGIIFHVTPSNMPINFFYSYLFGLLSGSINVVRLPTKNFIQNRPKKRPNIDQKTYQKWSPGPPWGLPGPSLRPF